MYSNDYVRCPADPSDGDLPGVLVLEKKQDVTPAPAEFTGRGALSRQEHQERVKLNGLTVVAFAPYQISSCACRLKPRVLRFF